MTWEFPTRAPFDMHLTSGMIAGCQFVSANEDTVVVDYDQACPLGSVVRMRGQFRMDSIMSLSYRAPIPVHASHYSKANAGASAPPFVGP
jgi:hypothetical protein